MARNLIVRFGWYERRPTGTRLAAAAAPLRWLACRLLAFHDKERQLYALKELDRQSLLDVGLEAGDLAATSVKALPERVECLCFPRVPPTRRAAAKGLDRAPPLAQFSR